MTAIPTFLESVDALLRTRWQLHIESVIPLPTQYDNAPFEEPETGPWCRFQVLPGQTERSTIGLPMYRHAGVSIAQVFTPIETGTRTALVVIYHVNAWFRDKDIVGLKHLTPYLTRVGSDGAWWQDNIIIPYQVDERGLV